MELQQLMKDVADKIERSANVKAVFGEPVGQGMDSVIPVARVSVRGGGGGGIGDAPDENGAMRKGKGRGMGVGLNVMSTPVGYIKRTPDGATYVPIVDKTRLFLAGAVVAGIGLLVIRTGIRIFGGK